MQEISIAIANVCQELFQTDVSVELTRPDEQFGDYASNVALQLSKQLGKNPREIAQAIADQLTGDSIASIEVAGPGFINIRLTDEALINLTRQQPSSPLIGKKYVVEYSCPNYFKELHAGHLYQTVVGDVIARLIENAGAVVHRANFGGDVGLHVAKAIYGMNKRVNGNFDSQDYSEVVTYMHSLDAAERPPFLAESYVLGSGDYENDIEEAKHWIESLNGDLYGTVFSDAAEDHLDQASKDQRVIFKMGQEWSRQYFDSFYAELQLQKQDDGSFFEYFPESQAAGPGRDMVQEYSAGSGALVGEPIFTQSDGATVFDGDKYGLHTRVFLTKKGWPTYEAKDLGVIFIEKSKFKFDHRILMTGSDQAEYMKVVWKAADLIQPGLLDKMTHLTHGTIRFGDGKKMSSRLGNVTRAVDVLGKVRELVGSNSELSEQIVLGAVKYEFLKYRLGGDIAFDPEESVATEGNSGPYLQYAYARACSILAKTEQISTEITDLQPGERSLVRKLTEYTDTVTAATNELLPHYICTYLYELAQGFNRFYEHNRVIGDEREAVRLNLVQQYATVLKDGLELLGIAAPEHM